VDEAATAFLTQVLGFGPRTGLSTAIVRKVRMLFWAIVGGLILVREGFTPGTLPATSGADVTGAAPCAKGRHSRRR
jgi:hypothetical protein